MNISQTVRARTKVLLMTIVQVDTHYRMAQVTFFCHETLIKFSMSTVQNMNISQTVRGITKMLLVTFK